MKTYIIIATFFTLFMCNQVLAQKFMPIATVAGVFDGKINADELHKSDKIEVKIDSSYKVQSFTIWSGRGHKIETAFKNKFSTGMHKIFRRHPRVRMIIHNIVAVNSSNDTLILNPIYLEKSDSISQKHQIPRLSDYPRIGGKSGGKISKNWLAAQSQITLKDTRYVIQNHSVYPPTTCCVCEDVLTKGSKLSANSMNYIRHTSSKRNVFIHQMDIMDKKGRSYRLPPMIFTVK